MNPKGFDSFQTLMAISNRKIDLFIMGTAGMAGVMEWMAEHQGVVSAWLIGIAVPIVFRTWKFLVDLKRSRELHRIAVQRAKEELKQTKLLNEVELKKQSGDE